MFVLINLKAYDVDPTAIAGAVDDAATSVDARVALAPQTAALSAVADRDVDTWAQHVSGAGAGSHTGSTHAAAAAAAGATGTILNHSERRLTLDELERAIAAADTAGLETVACANTPAQVAAATALGPDMVAVEPPELIGSGVPVSRADPDIVRDAVEAAAAVDPDVPVLCGAGISKGEDLAAAADLGATGVLLASGVAKADDPAAALADLLAPLS